MSATTMTFRASEISPQAKAMTAGAFCLLILVVGIVPSLATHADAFRFSAVAADLVIDVQRWLELAGLQGGAA